MARSDSDKRVMEDEDLNDGERNVHEGAIQPPAMIDQFRQSHSWRAVGVARVGDDGPATELRVVNDRSMSR